MVLGSRTVVRFRSILRRKTCSILDRKDPSEHEVWNRDALLLNEICRSNASVKDKIIGYFRRNAGNRIAGEELKYLAKDRKEWARRVRELRTEDGWPIVTRNSGRPDLGVGVYLLEEDRLAEEHDRRIPDPVRVEVPKRDRFQCVECGWGLSSSRSDDPRTRLELHHVKPRRERGDNMPDNLVTVCNVCHAEIHRSGTGE